MEVVIYGSATRRTPYQVDAVLLQIPKVYFGILVLADADYDRWAVAPEIKYYLVLRTVLQAPFVKCHIVERVSARI